MDTSHEIISTRSQTSFDGKKDSLMTTDARESFITDESDKDLNDRSINALRETFTLNTEKTQFGDLKSKVTTCRYDNDDMFIAVGCDDGYVRLYVTETKLLLGEMKLGQKEGNAIINIRWRPTENKDLTEHVFMASDAHGYLYHVHAPASKLQFNLINLKAKILHTTFEEGNNIYVCDYNVDGTKFATGGTDCKVRVYDEKKKSNFTILEESYDIPGHSNRILSMKFSKEHPDILLTGSWDQSVKIWDLRVGKPIKSIVGVQVYGDCLDISDNTILLGSYRQEKQIQLWDLGSKKLIENINWDPRHQVSKGAFITAAQFSKCSSKYILAASAKLNEIRLFDRTDNNKLCYVEMTRENVFSVDFSNVCDNFIHGGDGPCLTESKLV